KRALFFFGPKTFYERGCQEKIFPLTRRSGLSPDSQPRDIGGTSGRGRSRSLSIQSMRITWTLIPQSLAGCCSYGNHGSICDSRPIAISGYPRGTTVTK